MGNKGALSILSDKEIEGDGTLKDRAFHLFRKPRLSERVKKYSGQAAVAVERIYEGRARALGPDWFKQKQEEFGDVGAWSKESVGDAVSWREGKVAVGDPPTEAELEHVAKHGTMRDIVKMAYRIVDQDPPQSLMDSLGEGEGDIEGKDGEDGESDSESAGSAEGGEPSDLLEDVEGDEPHDHEVKDWSPPDRPDFHVDGRTVDYPQVHAIQLVDVKQIPVRLEVPTKSAVETSSTRGLSTMRYVGAPTSRVWQANYGTFRVFKKPTRSQPRIMLFVDLSGSMGCWCQECNPHEHKGRGYLAFQAAAAISAIHPKTEVYGFGSGRDGSSTPDNKILPLKPGYSPGCRVHTRGIPGGNNDCSMLLWLEGQMQGQEQDTVAIVISDGQPAGICGSEHTSQLSHLFVDRGMKLASILIGTNHRLYPAEVTAEVRTLNDMAGIWPVLSFVAAQGR